MLYVRAQEGSLYWQTGCLGVRHPLWILGCSKRSCNPLETLCWQMRVSKLGRRWLQSKSQAFEMSVWSLELRFVGPGQHLAIWTDRRSLRPPMLRNGRHCRAHRKVEWRRSCTSLLAPRRKPPCRCFVLCVTTLRYVWVPLDRAEASLKEYW